MKYQHLNIFEDTSIDSVSDDYVKKYQLKCLSLLYIFESLCINKAFLAVSIDIMVVFILDINN